MGFNRKQSDCSLYFKTIDDKLYLGANWAGVLAFPYPWNFISVYNVTTWKLIPKGPTYEVHAIEKFDSMIYVGGKWIQINDSTPCGYVARYDPTIIQDTTAILEVKQNGSAINIYPNPATNKIKISNLSPEENQIKIFNLLGQQVKSLSMRNEQNHTINISDLPTGIYMLTVSNNKKISSKKFVKE